MTTWPLVARRQHGSRYLPSRFVPRNLRNRLLPLMAQHEEARRIKSDSGFGGLIGSADFQPASRPV